MGKLRRDALFAIGLLSLQGLLQPAKAGAWSYFLCALGGRPWASLRQSQLLVNGLSQANSWLVLLTALAFLIWFYRSYKRLGRLHPASTNYRPAAAVWGFFVPILNLFRPIEIALEIWRQVELDRTWRVYAWWLTYLFAGLVASLALAVVSTQTQGEGWPLIAGISIVSSTLYTLAAWLAVVVVLRISQGLDALEIQSVYD